MHEFNSIDCVSRHIRRADRAIAQYYNSYLKSVGLKITQYTILSFLNNTGTSTASDLQIFLSADQTTVSRALKPLIRDAIVLSSEGADKRQKLLSLTKGGKTLYREAFPQWKKAQDELTQILGKDGHQSLMKMTDLVVSNLEKIK
ncbi:MAG: MarR family winged helix-turn-helix transcriptional regulator [Pseudomonadota bacterium]